MGWFPCCCKVTVCCGLYHDEFNRPDNTFLGAQYTEYFPLNGDWRIVANELVVQWTGGFASPVVSCVLPADLVDCEEPIIMNCQVDVTPTADGSIALLGTIAPGPSASFNMNVESHPGAGAGILRPTEFPFATPAIQVNFAPGTTHTMRVCVGGGLLAIFYDGDLKIINTSTNAPIAGFSPTWIANLGIAGPKLVDVKFDNLRASIGNQAEGTDCECATACCWPTRLHDAPAQMRVDIAGIINGTCISCAAMNGTYFLDPVACDDPNLRVISPNSGKECCYALFFDPATSPCELVSVELKAGGSFLFGACCVQLYVVFKSGARSFKWVWGTASPPATGVLNVPDPVGVIPALASASGTSECNSGAARPTAAVTAVF